ncbi:hypothetical protein EC973_008870 [Apophysomyces ossiformis]|uniref:Uncharacterized protein n=1 Tax=Apophysomyces ossiformis TaxID=679940 RepID=A0A8H7EUA3_9FUNG|nr:hypothetical protein EC973_008870 [Apophysomyces ossiformis]
MEVTENGTTKSDIVEDFARQLDQRLHPSDQLCYLLMEDFVVCISNSVIASEENSDSDDDLGEIPFGYEPLPQDEEELGSEHSGEVDVDHPELSLAPVAVSLDESEIIPEGDAFNKSATETSELIKSIMSNIKLSPSSIPGWKTLEWANKVPEALWMPQVTKPKTKD